MKVANKILDTLNEDGLYGIAAMQMINTRKPGQPKGFKLIDRNGMKVLELASDINSQDVKDDIEKALKTKRIKYEFEKDAVTDGHDVFHIEGMGSIGIDHKNNEVILDEA